MKNIPPLFNFSLKAEGGTNSVIRKCNAEIVRVECAKCRRECDLSGARATLCGDRACRVREMQARVRFVRYRRNPLRRSCVSSGRNAGESAICPMCAQPSAEILRVKCAKYRRGRDLSHARATLCKNRACRVREMQARVRFVPCARNPLRRSSARNAAICPMRAQPLRRSCVSRVRNAGEGAFWRLGASLLEEVLYETLVLETCRFTFGGSLVRNPRFGDLPLHFWRKSHTKRAFWRLGASLFWGSLVRNARFGDLPLHFWRKSRRDLALHFWRKSRTKRSFWRLGASLLEEVSYETLVLETCRFIFGGNLTRNARFGDLALHFFGGVSCETLVLETCRFTFGGSLRDLALHFWRKSRTKCSSWRLGASLGKKLFGAGLRSGQFAVQM